MSKLRAGTHLGTCIGILSLPLLALACGDEVDRSRPSAGAGGARTSGGASTGGAAITDLAGGAGPGSGGLQLGMGGALAAGSGGMTPTSGIGGMAQAGGAAGAPGSGGTPPAGSGGGAGADGGGGMPPGDAGPPPDRDASDAGPECSGQIRYTLAREPNPTAEQQAAYARITEAMDAALSYYNCYTNIDKELFASFVPSVPTADGNPNGSIRFGSTESMNTITAMHEISHTLGVGDNNWDAMMMDGIFPGPTATAQLRAITGNATDQVHGDLQHFWPYGLNYTSEVMSEQDLINHCLMVAAIREDLGY